MQNYKYSMCAFVGDVSQCQRFQHFINYNSQQFMFRFIGNWLDRFRLFIIIKKIYNKSDAYRINAPGLRIQNGHCEHFFNNSDKICAYQDTDIWHWIYRYIAFVWNSHLARTWPENVIRKGNWTAKHCVKKFESIPTLRMISCSFCFLQSSELKLKTKNQKQTLHH